MNISKNFSKIQNIFWLTVQKVVSFFHKREDAFDLCVVKGKCGRIVEDRK